MPEITDKEVMELVIFIAGFAAGWIAVDRPEWVKNLIYKIKG